MSESHYADPATESCLVPAMMPAMIDAVGASADSVLRRSGLPKGLFARLPAALTPQQFFALWSALDDEVESNGDGPMPLRLVEQVNLEYFDPLIFAFLNSPNVTTGFVRMASYKKVTSALRVKVDTSPAGLTVEQWWPAPFHAPAAVNLAAHAFGVWLVRTATKIDVQPVRVTNPNLPEHMGAYEQFFGVPITLGPKSRIEFSAIDSHRPLLTSNDSMWRAFQPVLQKRLTEIDAGASAEDRVRAALVELLPAGEDSIEAVARELTVSTRTLQRQLQAEDTSFQSVLNSTRERLAHHYLVNENLNNAEVAFLLGYEDTRSFYRAFRSGTGMSSKQARISYVA